MAKKNAVAAVIDIGSNEIRLHLAQANSLTGDKKLESINYLESLSYHLSLGRDTFHEGKLSFEKADEACEVIKNYLHVAKGYGVRNVKTIAGTAMREASNSSYIVDQIKIKTGVNVNITDELQEKINIYKLMTHYAEDLLKKSAVIVYIGTGSIGISLFTDGKMPRTWNIGTGSLRMSEMFGDLQEYSHEYHRLINDFLEGYTYNLTTDLPKGIKNFIVSGQEIEDIIKLTSISPVNVNEPFFSISRAEFEALYNRIKQKRIDSIANELGLNRERAASLLPAVCIYKNLLDFTEADTITASRFLPLDGVLFEMLHPKRFQSITKRFERGTIHSVQEIMQRMGQDKTHSEIVKEFAVTFFDKLKKIHGLEPRDKLLLITAAYLHDIGKCVNVQDHNLTSYEMVKRFDIVGLNQHEKEIVAFICRYHSGYEIEKIEPFFAELNKETQVRISKLTALIRLADALDRSHVPKFSKVSVTMEGSQLIVTVTSKENALLEKWAFESKGRFFAEVFGIRAVLKVKRR